MLDLAALLDRLDDADPANELRARVEAVKASGADGTTVTTASFPAAREDVVALAKATISRHSSE